MTPPIPVAPDAPPREATHYLQTFQFRPGERVEHIAYPAKSAGRKAPPLVVTELVGRFDGVCYRPRYVVRGVAVDYAGRVSHGEPFEVAECELDHYEEEPADEPVPAAAVAEAGG